MSRNLAKQILSIGLLFLVIAQPALSCDDHAQSENKSEASSKLSMESGRFGEKVDPLRADSQTVEGVVTEVCKEKGCWMKVKSDGVERKVKFKDYGFFVPQKIVGQKVRMNAVPANEGKEWISTGVEIVQEPTTQNAR